ncbi:nucleoporin-62 C-terminal-like protein [Heterocephalus glaber]|uniref:Nucleoporin-62 C-terminal-like protein n=1 Tax=Heterocephalus glaber TaxID=10181 RepID=A0A0P6J420_HETGA|nr:nucleoporin-62 C-terminal-like protein [Heterocephalus glaber]
MLFTSISNISTSTAATELLFGAPTTSARTLGGIILECGLKFSGVGGAASTTSTTTSTTTTTTVTTNTTTTLTSGFNLNLRSLTSTGINNTDLVSVSSVPLTSTVNSVVTPVMTYGQLDGLINKWSLEVEDQEKLFLHQATQVNAWDHILIKNGEKITALHREVEKVKLDQKRLGQELYFILSQKKESEDILTPAEESVDKSGPVYLLHADEKQERTHDAKEGRRGKGF